MITGRDFTVAQEQHRDRLSRAERQRLIQKAKNNELKTTRWQQFVGLVSSGDRAAKTTANTVQAQPGC